MGRNYRVILREVSLTVSRGLVNRYIRLVAVALLRVPGNETESNFVNCASILLLANWSLEYEKSKF